MLRGLELGLRTRADWAELEMRSGGASSPPFSFQQSPGAFEVLARAFVSRVDSQRLREVGDRRSEEFTAEERDEFRKLMQRKRKGETYIFDLNNDLNALCSDTALRTSAQSRVQSPL